MGLKSSSPSYKNGYFNTLHHKAQSAKVTTSTNKKFLIQINLQQSLNDPRKEGISQALEHRYLLLAIDLNMNIVRIFLQ